MNEKEIINHLTEGIENNCFEKEQIKYSLNQLLTLIKKEERDNLMNIIKKSIKTSFEFIDNWGDNALTEVTRQYGKIDGLQELLKEIKTK